jgi:hypothetical protein
MTHPTIEQLLHKRWGGQSFITARFIIIICTIIGISTLAGIIATRAWILFRIPVFFLGWAVIWTILEITLWGDV